MTDYFIAFTIIVSLFALYQLCGDFALFMMWIVGFGGVALIVLLLIALVNEGKKWEQFKIDHKCKIVEKISGSIHTGYGMTFNGKMGMVQTYSSGKTGWACDDGVTYYR